MPTSLEALADDGAVPVLYESHMHTPLCRHAVGEPGEYAEVARARGLKGIIVTCHNPLPDGLGRWSRMYEHQFAEYQAMVHRAATEWAGEMDIRLGLEADYMPGLEEWLRRQIGSAPFNYVLGSVHPQLDEFHDRFWTGDVLEFQRVYFSQLAEAAETGLYDTLSHPDLIKNWAPEEWLIERVLPDIENALDRIAATGMAMELNTSGLLKAISEFNPGSLMLQLMHQRGIPVVIGADAHVPQRVGDHYLEAMDHLERAGYQEVSFFLDRRRHDVPLNLARASLVAAGAAKDLQYV